MRYCVGETEEARRRRCLWVTAACCTHDDRPVSATGGHGVSPPRRPTDRQIATPASPIDYNGRQQGLRGEVVPELLGFELPAGCAS